MLKNLLKGFYYTVRPQSLPSGCALSVGYIFHTEQIHDDRIYDSVLKFCDSYQRLTGKRVICTLMSGHNALVQRGMRKSGCSPAEYAKRARRLSEIADLGYHGHFWRDPSRPESLDSPENQIRGENFPEQAVSEQLERDLRWFRESGLEHNGLYSAGWWFMHGSVQKLLISNEFTTDFSLSMSPWFTNPYSERLMRENGIHFGEAFSVEYREKQLLLVQNLIGCHHGPYPEDFIRNLKKLISPGTATVLGVVNSHDYDLDAGNTLRCLQHLAGRPGVSFLDHHDFSALRKKPGVKTVVLS